MPCYDPPPSEEELKIFRDKYPDIWYVSIPKETLSEWLCDSLGGNPMSEDCARWWEIHKEREKKK